MKRAKYWFEEQMAHLPMKKILAIIAALMIGLVSFLWAGRFTTRPGAFKETVASIDEKTGTVLKLTAAMTLASAAVSALPGDTATPISEELAEFSSWFLIVLCVLYAEKYLVGIIGGASFQILVPLAALIFIISQFRKDDGEILRKRSLKLALFALVIFFAIPVSMNLSDKLYESYANSVEEIISEAEDFSDETSLAKKSDDVNESHDLLGIVGSLSDKATRLAERATQMLKKFVNALAVMLVTTCGIPLLTLLFFIWLAKELLGADIRMPVLLRRRARGERHPAEEED